MNSRFKDYWDIYHLAMNFSFNADALTQALKSTFDNRATELRQLDKVFLPSFKRSTVQADGWDRFQQGTHGHERISFESLMDQIEHFILPPLKDAALHTWQPETWSWS